MRTLIIFGLIICFGCNPKMTNKDKNNQKHIESITGSEKSEDKGHENVLYMVFNGNVYDTIFVDSLEDKAFINDTLIIDSNCFVSYAVNSVGESVKGEPVNNFKGHFINSFDLREMDCELGDTIDIIQLDTTSTSFNLGSSCSNEDDIIKFENVESLPGSKNRFYFVLPRCSEWYEHILIEKRDGYFKKLFSIESTDYRLDFELQNDSILICEYNQLSEYERDTYDFKYDLIRNIEIK